MLPHLQPPAATHEELEGIRASGVLPPPVNLIDIDLDSTTAATSDVPLAPVPASPAAHFARKVKDGLVQTGARLRELRDPVAMVNRGVSNMNVVEESQRDEYIDSIAALHDTRPITTNPIWMDLLAAPAETRREQVPEREKRHERDITEQNHIAISETTTSQLV